MLGEHCRHNGGLFTWPLPPTRCRVLAPQPDPGKGDRAVEESKVEGRCGSWDDIPENIEDTISQDSK